MSGAAQAFSGNLKSNRDGDKTPNEYFEVEESGSNDDGEIKVKIFTGKIISLKVKGSDTFGSLKLQIEDKENIPFVEQELILDGKVIENIDTFANLHIKKQSTLTLVHRTSKMLNIFVDINNERMNYLYSFEVRPSDTIGILKAKLRHCMREGDMLAFNEMALESSGTFSDFNISNGSVLKLVHRSRIRMEIFVKTHTGETISLLVKPADTIAHVKWLIDCRIRIPVVEQALIFNKTILADSGNLIDFSINRNSTLTLLRKSNGLMPVFIKTFTEKETVTLEVKPSDTIYSIKDKLQHEKDIPCDDHELIYNDLVLPNDDTLVHDLDIKKESTLTLMRVATGFMNIFVETKFGKICTLDVKPSDTIQNLKSKIQCKLGIDSSLKNLSFHSVFLEKNSATLADYNISNESTVHLV